MPTFLRILVVAVVFASFAARTCSAQAVSAAASSTQMGEQIVWTYKFTIKQAKKGDTVEVILPIPPYATWSFSPAPSGVPAEEGKRGTFTWKINTDGFSSSAEDQIVTLTLSASEKLVKRESIQWTIKLNAERSVGLFEGPVALYDPSVIRPVFGGGASISLDDPIEFKAENDTLLTVNDSKLRAEAQVGVLFNLHNRRLFGSRDAKSFDILVSLQFAEGTTKILDGFTFGFGIGITPYTELIVGYTLRRGQELSKGFRAEAIRIIREQQDAENPDYQRFILNEARSNLINQELFDGLSLLNPATGSRFFPGDPIVQSFNSSISISILIPVDLGKLFERK